ncbi:MAG: glycosyltransferase family 9 protein [Vicinamibacterales bacterium]
MTPVPGGRWLLVHHTGSLGDTILAIPALRAVRAEWPNHRVALLTTAGRARMTARAVLSGDVLVDEFIEYRHQGSKFQLIRDLWRVARTIRRRQIDVVVSVLPSERPYRLLQRDRWFFRACGVRAFHGYDAMEIPGDASGSASPREDLLKLSRLAASGVSAALAPHGQMPLLTLHPQEREDGAALLAASEPGLARLAMGLRSNWPSKDWPLDRFLDLGRRARASGADVVGVGGPADWAAFETLRAAWGFGVNACGHPPRITAAVLAECQAFVGVDSGSAHLAASVGTPCVVAAWAGLPRGQWDPIGSQHHVVRLSVPCEGCRAMRCQTAGHPCMEDLSADRVWRVLEPLLIKTS